MSIEIKADHCSKQIGEWVVKPYLCLNFWQVTRNRQRKAESSRFSLTMFFALGPLIRRIKLQKKFSPPFCNLHLHRVCYEGAWLLNQISQESRNKTKRALSPLATWSSLPSLVPIHLPSLTRPFPRTNTHSQTLSFDTHPS